MKTQLGGTNFGGQRASSWWGSSASAVNSLSRLKQTISLGKVQCSVVKHTLMKWDWLDLCMMHRHSLRRHDGMSSNCGTLAATLASK